MSFINSEAMDWAFDRPIANSADKLVLLAIARRANKHWAAFPGKAEIARRTGLAERSIPKCIKRLEDDGHLVRIAFAGVSGQDQKIGYVLAGCGRLPDGLDGTFLALAFADRKQFGMPSAVKPQHWSGERTGEGRQPATRGGSPHSDPQGRQRATPRSKEHRNDQEGQEGTFGEARDKSRAIDDPAIAEAPAPPAARTTGLIDQEAPRIPAQRTYTSNRDRDDDWRVQLDMATPDDLYDALADYRDRLGALEDWAYRVAASDLGIDLAPDEEIPLDPDDDWTRAAYLYLLKRHDNDGNFDALFLLMEPLDPDTRAMPRPYQWVEKLSTPPGMTSQQFAEQMRAAVMQMEPTEVGPYIAEFRDLRPKVWHESRQQAVEWLRARKQKVTAQAMNCVALQLAIERYVPKGRWEMPLVPPSMRPTAMLATSEPPPWAA